MSVFNTKNFSPKQFAIGTSLFIALFGMLVAAFMVLRWYYVFIFGALIFLASYRAYYYTLDRFIFRKIKLIYKLISETKATKKEEFFYSNILPQKSLEDVEADVEQWAQQKTKQIELLQQNEAFRKEFLMNLAHELRTPIFTIQGYVETLIGGAMQDAQVSEKFLHGAAKSVDRLARLVEDLDEISKFESGKVPLNMTSFIIQDLVKDIYEEFSLIAQEKSVELTFKKGTLGVIHVKADKAKIRQVLVNLVENAIKYSNAGGMVSCGCYVLDEKTILVELSDNGQGIASQHLSRIFERFYRTDRSRNSKVAGTGLGLSIVKHILEAHGQTVTVRSKVNVGTSFTFTLQKDNS